MTEYKETYRFCIKDALFNEDGVLIDSPIIMDIRKKTLFFEQNRGGHYYKIEMSNKEFAKAIASFILAKIGDDNFD